MAETAPDEENSQSPEEYGGGYGQSDLTDAAYDASYYWGRNTTPMTIFTDMPGSRSDKSSLLSSYAPMHHEDSTHRGSDDTQPSDDYVMSSPVPQDSFERSGVLREPPISEEEEADTEFVVAPQALLNNWLHLEEDDEEEEHWSDNSEPLF